VMLSKGVSMQKRNRKRPELSLQARLATAATDARAKAAGLPLGRERDLLSKQARQSDVAAHLEAWLSSPGLQPPKR
jgi:hypothetical protein